MIDTARCLAILEQAGCDERVISHCRAVHAVAAWYADHIAIADQGLVGAGSFLHDVGRARTHTIAHAQEGADYCRSIGLPEAVARIVECHTGAGLTADECTLLGISPRDCIPRTIEEKIVCNADNLVAGTTRTGIDRTIQNAYYLPRGARLRIFRLWLELEACL